MFFFYLFLVSEDARRSWNMSMAYFLAENVLNENLNLLLDIDIRSELELHLHSLLNSDSSIEQIHLKLSTSDVTTDLPWSGS